MDVNTRQLIRISRNKKGVAFLNTNRWQKPADNDVRNQMNTTLPPLCLQNEKIATTVWILNFTNMNFYVWIGTWSFVVELNQIEIVSHGLNWCARFRIQLKKIFIQFFGGTINFKFRSSNFQNTTSRDFRNAKEHKEKKERADQEWEVCH